MTRLPAPAPRYDPQDQAELRRSIEQGLNSIAASVQTINAEGAPGVGTAGKIPVWGPGNTLVDSSISESGGVNNFANRPTVGAESLAYVSQLFTQTMADARYKPIGYVPSWGSITGVPTTIGGYGITDFNSLGDARWVQLANLSTLGNAQWLRLDGTGPNMTGTLVLSGTGQHLWFHSAGIADWFLGFSGGSSTFIIGSDVTNPILSLAQSGGAASFVGAVTVNGTLTTNSLLITTQPMAMGVGSTTYGYLGIVTAAGSYVNDGALGDMIIRSQAKPIRFSVDSGATTGMLLDTSAGLAVAGTIRSASTYGWMLGNVGGFNRIYWNTDHFEIVNSSNQFTSMTGSIFSVTGSSAIYNFYDRTSGVRYGLYADNSTGRLWSAGFGDVLWFGYSTGDITIFGNVTLNTAGKTFKDSFGNPMAPIIVSSSAPSGTAADRTLWIQV